MSAISMIDPAEAQKLSHFDYSNLPDDVADEARAAAMRIRGGMKSAIIEAGREFIAIKARLPHGTFLPWIRAEFGGMSERTVQRYMRAAETLGEVKNDRLSDLPAEAVHRLAAKSTPPAAREHALDLLERSEAKLTDRQVTDLVDHVVAEAKGKTISAPPPPSADDVLLSLIDGHRKVWAAERLLHLVDCHDDLAREALETLVSEDIAMDDWREWLRHRVNERCYRRFQALRDEVQRKRAVPQKECAEKPAGPEAEKPEDGLPTDDPRWFEHRDGLGRRRPLPKLQLDILRVLQAEDRQPVGDRVDHLLISADIIAALGLPADDNPAQCSIAQACRRLEGRGLVQHHIQPGLGSRYFWSLVRQEVPT